jgi:hypothetical protein
MVMDVVVLAAGRDVFGLRTVATGGRRLPSGSLSFAGEKTLFGLMSWS